MIENNIEVITLNCHLTQKSANI